MTRPDDAATEGSSEVAALRAALAAERARRVEAESRQGFFRGALDQFCEAVMITEADPTPPSRAILYVNPAFCALTGYATGEVLGASPKMLWTESSDPEVVDALRDCLSAGRSFRGETWVRRKDGREVLVAQHVAPVREGDGAVERWVSILRDVTPERRAQEARRREEAAEHQARRLESLGRLASGIVHDFNNLLAAVLANAELLGETVTGEDREVVDEVRVAAQHGRALTRQLLLFCARDVAAPRELDIDEAARDAMRMLRRLLGDTVRVETRLAAAPARVRMDVSQFGQVLMNLCLNARDAMPDGGRLSVETGADDDRVTLTVRDDGTGMSPAVRAKLFEPFFTTKPPGEGAGLGLATVRGIARALGGDVDVESAPGRGTAMRVSLPRVRDAADAVAPTPRALTPAPRAARLLVVDDDPALLKVVERALVRAGYDVLAASSPGEALLAAEREERPIDLLLTDVAMAYLDGPSLAARLRAQRPALPALFMSAHAAPEVLRACGGALLAKPFATAELLARVAAALG